MSEACLSGIRDPAMRRQREVIVHETGELF